jgi:hypothetical protein
MAAKKETRLLFTNLRGMNGTDPPALLPEDQCQSAFNVEFPGVGFATKRNGTINSPATGTSFTTPIKALLRHVPGSDETLAEMFAFVDSGTTVGRLAGSATWRSINIQLDTMSATAGAGVTGASLNGLLHLGMDTAVNRSHVFDPSKGANGIVRRSGFYPPAAPSPAAGGAGGLSFTRVYRQRWVDITGSTTYRISEPSATASITIAAKTGVTVTMATLAGEGETYWDLEAADTTAGPFYRIARTVVGTTTFADTSATIATTNLSATVGINVPPPSYKYVVRDGNRLVMAGAWETSAAAGETTPSQTRVWFTPVLGTTDIGDSERVLAGNYIDVDTAPTGLGVLADEVFVFAFRAIYKLVRTGLSTTPYVRKNVSDCIGCIRHQSIVNAEDESGNPALYFMSHKGPYRLGVNGLQYLGYDMEWAANLYAIVVPHAVYHSEKHQVWWTMRNPSSTAQRWIFDTRLGRPVSSGEIRGGWALGEGNANAYASVLFSRSIDTAMGTSLAPYLAMAHANNTIWAADSAGALDDVGTPFLATIQTRDVTPGGIGRQFTVTDESFLMAKCVTGATITVLLIENFGAAFSANGTALLTATGTESRAIYRLEGLQPTQQLDAVSFLVGDSVAVAKVWTLDALWVDISVQD